MRYVVGRHDAADIVFEDACVSRLHGVLSFDEGEWWFEDYASSNGTLVKGEDGEERSLGAHIPERVVAGDVVMLGSERCGLELSEHELDDDDDDGARDLTTVSEAARDFARRLSLAAKTRVPVFLLGPSGVGKTWAAQQIHKGSAALGMFVPVNCARLPQDAAGLHSELLGHVRGAFTGADSPRTGRLVFADGGTLFLDEVESLSPLAQGFLLDVLEQSGDLSPLGAKSPTARAPVFRLISASKRPLGESGLRADLCERLAEGHMWKVPTLDERRADIPGLIACFAREQEKLLGAEVVITDDAVALACGAEWPGQIRQLRSTVVALLQLELAERALAREPTSRVVLRRAALLAHLSERSSAWSSPRGERAREERARGERARDESDDDHDDERAAEPPQRGDSRRMTRAQVLDALHAAGGNQSEAARALGVARNTLARKMKAFHIEKRIG